MHEASCTLVLLCTKPEGVAALQAKQAGRHTTSNNHIATAAAWYEASKRPQLPDPVSEHVRVFAEAAPSIQHTCQHEANTACPTPIGDWKRTSPWHQQAAVKQEVGTCHTQAQYLCPANARLTAHRGAPSTPTPGGRTRQQARFLQPCLHPQPVQLECFCFIRCVYTVSSECSAILGQSL